ncbi:DUF6130 family protein [Caulobacter sp. KR2-114]|uniref:DUF6130 family protein n=1 Tax=Caulobacter sp. KR2-114 TaxID=3400912 RepID=UPI003BFFB60D
MTLLTRMLVAVAAGALFVTQASAQSAKDVVGATPWEPVENEPPARLIVDPPLAEPLSRGAAVIQYRTENFRILPVLGTAAVNVTPRAGHLHVTVDDLPWHWADAGDSHTIIVVGLPPGQHKILIELADPLHHVVAGQAVTFVVPAAAPHAH